MFIIIVKAVFIAEQLLLFLALDSHGTYTAILYKGDLLRHSDCYFLYIKFFLKRIYSKLKECSPKQAKSFLLE